MYAFVYHVTMLIHDMNTFYTLRFSSLPVDQIALFFWAQQQKPIENPLRCAYQQEEKKYT